VNKLFLKYPSIISKKPYDKMAIKNEKMNHQGLIKGAKIASINENMYTKNIVIAINFLRRFMA
jgi:hypothetical protein